MIKKLISLFVGMAVMVMPTYAENNLEYDYVKQTIQDRYLYELPATFGGATTVSALFEGLDHYSKYLTRAELTGLQHDLSGGTAGIGVYLSESPRSGIQVAEIVPGSPADGSLQKGDRILFIDGVATCGQELQNTALRIRGIAGTRVTVAVSRTGVTTPKTITLVRAVVPIKTVNFEIFKNGAAYVRIIQFTENTATELQQALASVKSAGAAYLVLDLRDNPGGLLDSAVNCARQLMPAGEIVTINYRDNRESFRSDSGAQPFSAGKVAVLINGNTASAAEILAMAIKENGVGILVGEKTFGKGAVQRLYNIPSGGFKLTEGEYLGPKGTAINHVGLQPDHAAERYSPKLELAATPPVSLSKKLQPGDTGQDVLALQLRLKWLGYPCEEQSGTYGDATTQAVTAYQSAQGLYPYGILDLTTQTRVSDGFLNFLSDKKQDLQLLTAIQKLGCGT